MFIWEPRMFLFRIQQDWWDMYVIKEHRRQYKFFDVILYSILHHLLMPSSLLYHTALPSSGHSPKLYFRLKIFFSDRHFIFYIQYYTLYIYIKSTEKRTLGFSFASNGLMNYILVNCIIQKKKKKVAVECQLLRQFCY